MMPGPGVAGVRQACGAPFAISQTRAGPPRSCRPSRADGSTPGGVLGERPTRPATAPPSPACRVGDERVHPAGRALTAPSSRSKKTLLAADVLIAFSNRWPAPSPPAPRRSAAACRARPAGRPSPRPAWPVLHSCPRRRRHRRRPSPRHFSVGPRLGLQLPRRSSRPPRWPVQPCLRRGKGPGRAPSACNPQPGGGRLGLGDADGDRGGAALAHLDLGEPWAAASAAGLGEPHLGIRVQVGRAWASASVSDPQALCWAACSAASATLMSRAPAPAPRR